MHSKLSFKEIKFSKHKEDMECKLKKSKNRCKILEDNENEDQDFTKENDKVEETNTNDNIANDNKNESADHVNENNNIVASDDRRVSIDIFVNNLKDNELFDSEDNIILKTAFKNLMAQNNAKEFVKNATKTGLECEMVQKTKHDAKTDIEKVKGNLKDRRKQQKVNNSCEKILEIKNLNFIKNELDIDKQTQSVVTTVNKWNELVRNEVCTIDLLKPKADSHTHTH